jgi:hypothetical protein
MVLPIPVGACASTQRPLLLALKTVSARWRWPSYAFRAVGQLLFCPGDEAFALGREQCRQRLRRAGFAQHGFGLAGDVEIHQREMDFGQPQLLAQQVTIHAQLCPVQMAVVVAHAGKLAAVGLDLFEQVLLRVVAVGPSAHMQRPEVARKADLGLIARPAPRADHGVSGHAFLGGGGGREAQVEVALLGGKFAQRAHGDHVTQAASSDH